jgi:hypothetical protein
MAKPALDASDFDSPWKEALDQFLDAFLAFFFPAIHADVDWTRGHEALDKEFQQIIQNAGLGKRLADKLFKVWLRDGLEQWLLIHVEVQGDYESIFSERMFVYNVRAFLLYNRPVVSLAVLTDEQPEWRPNHFAFGRWGSTTEIHFPIVKLIDWAKDSEALEQNNNPFAAVVLAHLRTLQTRQQPETRGQWKLRLVKGLYQRDWTADQVRQLFRLIDWIMALPEALEEEFRIAVFQYEEEKRMPYVTSIERLALAEGREIGREEGREVGLLEGLQEGLVVALEAKFGPTGRKLTSKVKQIQHLAQLRTLEKKIKAAKSIESVRKHLD